MGFEIAPEILEMNPRVVLIAGKTAKGPTVPNWVNIQERAEDLVKKNGGCLQFESDRYYRYGIILDEDMLCVDVDVHEGQPSGYVALMEIEKECGVNLFNEASLVVESPSGGSHLFFTKDAGTKLPKSVKEYKGLDWLSKGAQVIGAGSRHVSNGKPYIVTRSSEKGPQPIPEIVVDLVKASPSLSVADRGILFQDREGSGDSPLDDFNRSPRAIQVIVRLMEDAGYSFIRKQDHFEFVRPGKTSSHAISGTLGRVNTAGNPYLHNFSTSDCTFPADSISLSEAYRLITLSSRDDLPSELAAIGFGEKKRFDQYADPLFHGLFEGKERHMKYIKSGEQIEREYPTIGFGDLVGTSEAKRRGWVIENLLRRGEVMNIIAAPKVGKSWMVYGLSLSMACGKEFIGYKSSKNLKVLICDNELHREELAWRVQQVARSLGVNPAGGIEFTLLRGSDVDVDALDRKIDEVGGSRFDVVVIDAFYRILPRGMSENDNAAMTQIFNKLDAIARKNDTAVINIHHSSKGNQADKGVTDVGAGAGAISRAADTHLVIRQHVEDNHVVIEAVTRSGISPSPVTAEFKFPLWIHKPDMEPIVMSFDAARGKVNESRKDERQEKVDEVIAWIKEYEDKNNSQPVSTEIYDGCKLSTWGVARTFKVNLKRMVSDGLIKEVPTKEGVPNRYTTKVSTPQ